MTVYWVYIPVDQYSIYLPPRYRTFSGLLGNYIAVNIDRFHTVNPVKICSEHGQRQRNGEYSTKIFYAHRLTVAKVKLSLCFNWAPRH
jgi:hypothetical protein